MSATPQATPRVKQVWATLGNTNRVTLRASAQVKLGRAKWLLAWYPQCPVFAFLLNVALYYVTLCRFCI